MSYSGGKTLNQEIDPTKDRIWAHFVTTLYIYNIFVYCSDAVVSQVLDELGLQLTDQLSGLPQASGSLAATGGKVPAMAAAAGGGAGPGAGTSAGGGAGAVNDADADLQARLDNLRRE